jgi:FG-GAP repeat
MKQKMRSIITTITFLLLVVYTNAQTSISVTYTLGLIPTSFDQYDESCNGPSATLALTLPAGDCYQVTSVDVSYTMTGFGSGWKSHQRSKLKFENNGIEEAIEAVGFGDSNGTQTYSRSISIANGVYAGGQELVFQMKARRTQEGNPGCNNLINRVDQNTWTITVHYTSQVIKPKVGINNSTPSQTLDIAGKLKLGNDVNAPEAGTIRWNTINHDFEGFNGTEWMSFTKNDGGNWGSSTITENQQGLAMDGATNDQFGTSVSISGDYAIVGAYLKNIGSNSDQGQAYIFKRTGTTWIDQGILVAPDGISGDLFGRSVAISGEYVIVGAYNKDVGANAKQGRAYIFKRSGNTWNLEANITGNDGATEDNFGFAVSISNDYAVVSSVGKDVGSNIDQGKIYIYKRSGSTWTLHNFFTASDGAGGDRFGISLAMSNYYFMVGANQKDIGSNIDQGKAYVYKRTGTTWAQQYAIVSSDGAANDFFGSSVSITEDYAIVGAYAKNVGSNSNQGKVYIFKRSGPYWIEQVGIVANDANSSDYFGGAVSINGDYAVVGAYGKAVDNNFNQGKVYIFNRVGLLWIQQAGISSSDGSASNQFGNAVSISGNHIIVGAPFKNVGNNANQGKVYFIEK